MGAATKQANFLLPEDLLEELKRTVSPRRQSRFVTEALRKELMRLRLARAIEESFGAWKEKGHPDLAKGTDSYI
ncbi:MAG: hypothetical protein ACYC9V_01970, partial [Desulfobacteria bacterium]